MSSCWFLTVVVADDGTRGRREPGAGVRSCRWRTHLDEWGVTVVDLGHGITVGTRWAIGDVDTGELIDNAEIIDGLPFADLESVVSYKRLAQRPKDLVHLAVIEQHTTNRAE